MKNRILLGLMLYVTLVAGSFMTYHLMLPVRISFHVLALAGITVYLVSYGLPDNPLTIGALLMVAAVIIAIPTALDPRMALENGWNWIVNLLALLCFIHLIRQGHGQLLFNAHYIAGGLVAVVAIVEFVVSGGRPMSIFLNISITGAYMAALIIPVFNAGVTARNSLGYKLLTLFLVVAVLVGENRGSLLNVGVAAAIYFTLTWQKAWWIKFGVLLTAATILLGVVVLLSNQPNHSDGDVIRVDLWRAAGDMIQQYPLGVGPGLFAHEYQRTGSSDLNQFVDAHNHYLTLGAELGAPGLAAGAVLVLIALYYLLNLKLTRNQIAVLAALVGIAAHMLVDSFPSDNWALLVALYAAYLLYEARCNINWRPLRLLGTCLAVALTIWTIQIFQFDRAQLAYEAGIRTGRIYDVFDAVDLDPTMQLYHITLGRMLYHKSVDMTPNMALTLYGRMYR